MRDRHRKHTQLWTKTKPSKYTPNKIHTQNGAVNNNLRTLHQCFLTLGADETEIYTGANGYCRRGWQKLRERYCREELLDWARRLYLMAMRSVHPDHGGDCSQAALVNVAYERVQRILAVKRVII